MGWFFETDQNLELARPRFIYPIEYAALTCDIVSLALTLANNAFLIVKIRRASAPVLLIALLVASLAATVLIISHMTMLYLAPTPAALSFTMWGSIISQIIVLLVETEAIQRFVFNFNTRIMLALRAANAVLYQTSASVWSTYIGVFDVSSSIFTAWRIHQLSRANVQNLARFGTTTSASSALSSGLSSPQSVDAQPGLPTSAQIRRQYAASVRTAIISHGAARSQWYQATNTTWNIYVGVFDFATSIFTAWRIFQLSRRTMQMLVVNNTATSAPSAADQTPAHAVRESNASDVRLHYASRVRMTIISLVLFFIVITIACVFSIENAGYRSAPLSIKNLLYAIATLQVTLGLAGPHVAFISVMFYNMTQMVLASHGRASAVNVSKNAKKATKSATNEVVRSASRMASMAAPDV
ncbi:hypothetical protein HK105_206635 [Polyrhizophydium stewartii]|uniref:G-protein coupled receptors family 1 profile domain-containing protein n=1 Tax=Polyrhizophydium stewartii TaxID=2732419 RepID=A0ABR4N2Z8_9FUNG